MSAHAAILVENLAKRYIIGHNRSKDDGLRHAVENAIRAPIEYLRSGGRRNGKTREEFWALRDVHVKIEAARSSASSGATALAEHPAEDPGEGDRSDARAMQGSRPRRGRCSKSAPAFIPS